MFYDVFTNRQPRQTPVEGCKMSAMNRILFMLLGCIFCSSLPANAKPAAIVTDVEGSATLQRGAQAVRVAILTEIGEGEVVELADKARLVIVHFSLGHEYLLRGPARVRVGFGSLETLAGANPERRDARAGVWLNPSGLVQAGVQMRGTPQSRMKLISPLGVRVLDPQPEFVWEAVAGAGEYHFSLSGDNGAAVFETRIAESRVRLPAGVALAAGRSYAWKVIANVAGAERSASGGFATATEDLAEEARRTRPPEGAPISDLVAYALWLRQSRLADEARRYWSIVSVRRPDEPIVKELAVD